MEKLTMLVHGLKKASDYISGTETAVSFVSTNSLFQGESVPCLWDKLLEPNGNIAFSFAYEPFSWSSEAKDSAVVSCVITGFTDKGCDNKERRIYLNDGVLPAKNINGYLLTLSRPFVAFEDCCRDVVNTPKKQGVANKKATPFLFSIE